MNYITTCPACETQFLLTTDQLKVQRGKVQCGHCQHVFNAKNRLTEVSEGASEGASSDDRTTHAIGIDANELNVENSTSDNLNMADGQANNSQITNSQVYNDKIDGDSSETNDFSTAPYTDFDGAENAGLDDYKIYDEQTGSSNASTAPTFIQDLTTEPQFTKEPFNLKKLLIALLGLFLLILALLQAVFFFRTQLAAQYPQAKPYLQQICQALQCEIKLAQNLNLLTIDDSDMQESDDYQDVISFSSVLINNANYVQAYPNIELTLTDTQDQPVLRKLVTPKEYLAENVQVEAGMNARQELRLNLAIDASDLIVAGYRVLLVY